MWFIGVEVEQETSAPPPKKNPGSAPVQVKNVRLSFTHRGELALLVFLITFPDNRKYFLIYF